MMDLSNPRAGGGAMGGKLAKIKSQLQALQARQRGQDKVGGGETITDDGRIPADRKAQIVRDEDMVRQVLALFGIDYDSLIRMDGKDGEDSVYARAVQANPQLLQDVLGSGNPVIAALKVAVGFKPVAEFTAKYGSSPEAIKAAMRAEFEAENKPKPKKAAAAEASPVFSRHGGGFSPAADGEAAKDGGLGRVFGK